MPVRIIRRKVMLEETVMDETITHIVDSRPVRMPIPAWDRPLPEHMLGRTVQTDETGRQFVEFSAFEFARDVQHMPADELRALGYAV